MLRKLIIGVLQIFLVVSVYGLVLEFEHVRASGIIYIRADGSIDPSPSLVQRVGDTYQLTGDICDSVVVERNNSILDGQGYCLQGYGAYGSVGLDLVGENVTAKNLRIERFFVGVNLLRSKKNIIYGNTIVDNHIGMELVYSAYNSIFGNNVTSNNSHGIILGASSNNTISWNNITANGISLFGSSSNSIFGNNLIGSSMFVTDLYPNITSINNSIYGNVFVNDGLVGILIGNTVEDNWVNGKPLVYLEGESDYVIEDAGQVILVNCNRIKAENLNLSNTETSVFLWRTYNTEISGNTISHSCLGIGVSESANNSILGNHIEANNIGIRLTESLNNNISGNNIVDNWYGLWLLASSSNNQISRNTIMTSKYNGIRLWGTLNNSISENNIVKNPIGIWIEAAMDNSIFLNNFVSNIEQVNIQTEHTPSYTNFWDDKIGKGNYLSDYLDEYPNASEVEDNGVWDTPYIIDEYNQDNYPLVNPHSLLSGDMNYDFKIDMRDIAAAAWALGTYPTHQRWNSQADVNQDNRLDMQDLVIIASDFGRTYFKT